MSLKLCINKHFLPVLCVLFISLFSFSQEKHWNKELLNQIKGTKVLEWEKATGFDNIWYVKLKKHKKIGIYQVEICDEDDGGTNVCYVQEIIQPLYDKIEAFVKVDKEKLNTSYFYENEIIELVTLRKRRNLSVGFRKHNNHGDYEFSEPSLFFENIDWTYASGTQVAVSNNGKWGIYDWFNQTMILKCNYDAITDFPKTDNPKGLDVYEVKIFSIFNRVDEKDRIDKIGLDRGNGDGVFKGRHKESKKWGLYQYLGEDEIRELIPMKYDSLAHFSWNGNYTAVYNNKKVGFYLSYWSYGDDARETVSCIYEDYKKFVTEDQIPRLAVKRDGKWGWVDWLTGEEKSEFKYDTPESLPYPYYEQKLWVED